MQKEKRTGVGIVGWMRYHIASQFDFVTRIVEEREGRPSFLDGYKVQEVIEAAQVSAREKRKECMDIQKPHCYYERHLSDCPRRHLRREGIERV